MGSGLNCLTVFLFILSSGVLPDVAGETPSSKQIELHWAASKPTIAIFTFSREAAADGRAWRQRIAQDAEVKSAARILTIIMLESVPRLLRPMVKSAIKSSMSTEKYDS